MKTIIDIHSHLLPGLDDGCRTEADALAMLKMYENQNVEAVICTPHYGPCGNPGADIKETFERLRSKSRTVRLYPGSEIHDEYFDPDGGESSGQFSLAGSPYFLIEFEEYYYRVETERILSRLSGFRRCGRYLILAHPERYSAVQENPAFCRKLAEIGVGLQINAYDVYENSNQATVRTARYLLDNRLVTHIGSDAHRPDHRPPALAVGVQWIYDHYPEDYADAIVHDNAEKILRGLPPVPPSRSIQSSPPLSER